MKCSEKWSMCDWPASRFPTFITCATRRFTAASGCACSTRRRGRWALPSDANPIPAAGPGYLRVDTVHQGNHDGQAGLFHINAVDTVTQWEVVGCVEAISERYLMPVLEAMFHQCPFL